MSMGYIFGIQFSTINNWFITVIIFVEIITINGF